MLETWKQAYLDVRKRIEQSGRDARWEFNRKSLFERTDHVCQICSDIHDVAQVCALVVSSSTTLNQRQSQEIADY